MIYLHRKDLMPSLHLLRSSYDGLVYDFSWGHRRWLRATMFTFTLFTVIVRFHVLGIVEGPKTKPYRGCTAIVQRLYGGRREIVRFLRGHSNIFTEIVRRSYDPRTETVRWPQGEGIYIECHLRSVWGLRSYDLENLYNFALNKIVEAMETLRRPWIRTKIVRSSYATAGWSCD